jgi:aryl-alcohol dehydrogenase-like predicted oxidoreductase
MQLINKIILGTVQLGLDYGINNTSGKPSAEETVEILNNAYTNGIGILDTAEVYGIAHEVIGKFHKQYSDKKFQVITKGNTAHADISKEHFRRQFLQNLDVLHIDFLQGYLFHSFDHYRQFEYWDVLETFLAENKLAKIGVSAYTNEQINCIEKDSRISVVQLPFNLLDNIYYRGKALEVLKEQRKEVHVRSVFLQGLFFKERKSLGKLSPLQNNLYQLDALAVKAATDIGTLALGYALHQCKIDKVLIGVENKKQLHENIKMLGAVGKIPVEIYSSIDEIQAANPNLLNPNNW